jgi:hypothetical protein
MNKMDLTRRGFLQTTNLLAAGTMSLDGAALAGLAESPFSIQSTQVKRVRFKSRRFDLTRGGALAQERSRFVVNPDAYGARNR